MNKVSISKIDDVMKSYDNIVSKDWNGIELKIKRRISYTEMHAFVDKVVEACFSPNGDYLPENKFVAIRECVLTMYANVTLPAEESHKYNILYCSDLFDIVMGEIDTRQYETIVDAILDKTDFIAEMNVQHIYTEVNQVVSSMKALTDEFGKMFSGITSDDVKTLLGAVSSGRLDEEKLVEAYLKQTK